jgi:lipopolysaccharide/colanic/teichoic acid biosynthesis glycosyltransferase
MFYRRYLKPVGDFWLALAVFVLLLPFFVIITFVLYIANDRKPFFCQQRPGKNGRIFRIIKFKTMNDRQDSAGRLLPDAERLTNVGSFIRKTSLDELPQLINVIKGDMSLIGPRPLLPEYLSLYNKQQRRRHEVRPGITGWAQVNGRNAISWSEKFNYDVWYVDHVSFSLDLRILLLTLKKVSMKEGISSGTSVTMEKFNGN